MPTKRPRPEPWNDDERLTSASEAARASFGDAFERLVGLMARLRAPGGCPWDREQSLASLRAYLIEEAYEVIEAIDQQDAPAHREELGDLLLQVVFQAELRREEGQFDAADVAHAIADKLVRRHPHVFGEEAADGVAQAFRHWEKMKAAEKDNRSVLDGVPRALPALLRAQRTTEKASRVGFDWNDRSGPLDKLTEELGELREAIESGDPGAVEDELGDVLFTVVNLSRFLGVGAEDALNAATDKFTRRFRHVEDTVEARGERMDEMSIDALEALWQRAK